MIKNKLYSEIFDEFQKAGTRQEKVDTLRKYETTRFRTFFELLFNESVKFTTEIPIFKPSVEPVGLNWSYIEVEIPKLYRFIEGKNSHISLDKQKKLLTIVLEALHVDEAAILIKLIEKDLQIKYLTPNIVREAFPGINIQ